MATTNCYDFCWNSSINIQTVLKSLWYRFITLHYMLKSIREYLNKIKSFRSFLATKTPSYRLLKILMRGDLVVVLLTKNFMFWIVEKLSQLQNCTDSSRSAIFYTRPSRCFGRPMAVRAFRAKHKKASQANDISVGVGVAAADDQRSVNQGRGESKNQPLSPQR